MKRSMWVMTALALAVLVLAGCGNNQTRAQRLYDAGRYDEVVARYGSDPAAQDVVAKARDKIADGLLQAGRYQAVIDSFPQTNAAKEAMNKLADQMFQERRYQEIIDKYPTTDAAGRARSELQKMQADSAKGRSGTMGRDNTGTTGSTGSSGDVRARNQTAQAELDRILNIRVPDLRAKALREFVANPQYAGTDALRRAQSELTRVPTGANH